MLREQKEMTQTELSAMVKTSKSSLSTYENGLTPPVNVVVESAKFFGVTTDYLLGVSDEMRPTSSDELSRKFDRLFTLAGNHTINRSDILELLDAEIKYYRAGAKAEHAPSDALRNILDAMTDLFICAAGDDMAAVLSAVNAVTRHTLSVTGILNSFLTNTKAE